MARPKTSMRHWHKQTLQLLDNKANSKKQEHIFSSLFLAGSKKKLPYFHKIELECTPARWGEIDFWYLVLSARQYAAGKYERRKKSKNRVVVKEPILYLTLNRVGYRRFFWVIKNYFFRMANLRKTGVSTNGAQTHIFPHCQNYEKTLRVQSRLNIALDGVNVHMKSVIANYNKENASDYLFSFFQAPYLL